MALDAIGDLKYSLYKRGIEAVDYSEENKVMFEILPSTKESTVNPALVKDGVLLKKGVATGGNI